MFPGQVGDVLGIPARHVRVGQAGKERLADGAIDRGGRGGERPLHLVEDDPLVAKAALWVSRVFELEADAFLLERVFRKAREKSSVEVDLEEVHEVLGVARAVEEHRPVRTCQGVHERRQRTPRHAEEGIAHRKAMRARQHDVLEDVRNARRIGGRGGEENGERIVVIGAFDVDVASASPIVLQLDERSFESLQWLASLDGVAPDGAHAPDGGFSHSLQQSRGRHCGNGPLLPLNP